MTERIQRTLDRRDRLLEAARKEFAEFERRENEFRKKDREERAAELRLPVETGRRIADTGQARTIQSRFMGTRR
jgi:hypothetical protein